MLPLSNISNFLSSHPAPQSLADLSYHSWMTSLPTSQDKKEAYRLETTQNLAISPSQTCLLWASAICSEGPGPSASWPWPLCDPPSLPYQASSSIWSQILPQQPLSASSKIGSGISQTWVLLALVFTLCVCLCQSNHSCTIWPFQPNSLTVGAFCTLSPSQCLANRRDLLMFERVNAAFITWDIDGMLAC